MPLILNKMINDGDQLLVWETLEEEASLYHKMNHSEPVTDGLENTLHPKRIREKLAISRLLQMAFKTSLPIELSYDSYGKPFLPSFQADISISHTGNFAAILLSAGKTPGIDIETIKERILRLSDKFISKEELGFIEDNTRIEQMHVIWGAKESVYKMYGKRGVDFKENMKVQAFTYAENGKVQTLIEMPDYQKNITIYYKKISNCMLTWGLNAGD